MTWHDVEAERREREDALGLALRALPAARAPHTLAPRVMAAVHAQLQAGRHAGHAHTVVRTWFDWSVWAQLASVAAFMVLVASLAMVWPSVDAGLARLSSGGTVRVASLLFHAVWQPLMTWVVAGVTMTALFCAMCGALLTRIALGGASR